MLFYEAQVLVLAC